jgi:hypothetical protein
MRAGNVIYTTNLLRSQLDFSQIPITVDLIFFPNHEIINITERIYMLGYTRYDLEKMIASVDIAIIYLEDHVSKEALAMKGLADTANFLEGIIAEGHV